MEYSTEYPKDMDWYFWIVMILLPAQLAFTIQIGTNVWYAYRKSGKKRDWYSPDAVVIVPCKGLDSAFEQNILSFFRQDYKTYRLWFVVEDASDTAYPALQKIISHYASSASATEVRLFIAGKATQSSQKLHNILCCYRQIPAQTEALVFADSDACADSHWLGHIVYSLHSKKTGATSGYRWFVPRTRNMASLALSCLNAAVAQVLGNNRLNQAWGGSMAILVETFRQINLETIWSRSICDDLTLSGEIRRAGKKMIYVPPCMVASYESTTWPKLFEFVRRQFVITRIYAPQTWLFGLSAIVFSVGGLWCTVGFAAAAWRGGHTHAMFFTLAAIFIFLNQAIRAILRQWMIACFLLVKDKKALRPAAVADITLFWIWGILLLIGILSSSAGKTIRWRGIRYRIKSPLDVVIETEK
jgi:cellulose synthase/poly-beta-1,6-N-acetylglucosamine synthase-like glycosyltransferase